MLYRTLSFCAEGESPTATTPPFTTQNEHVAMTAITNMMERAQQLSQLMRKLLLDLRTMRCPFPLSLVTHE